MHLYSLEELRQKQEEAKVNGCVIFAGNGGSEYTPIPEIGKTYYAYNDGKIHRSREYTVTVQDIVTYDNLPIDIKAIWQSSVIECYWLYAPQSDYFIRTLSGGGDVLWFARTEDGEWFSFGSFLDDGLLDVTGELHETLIKGVVE